MWYENCVPKPTVDWRDDYDIPNAVWCDLDGTLAHKTDRGYFEEKYDTDKIDESLEWILSILQDFGDVSIVFVSGREGTELGRKQTEQWLTSHGFPIEDNFSCRGHNRLFMRKEGDNRNDTIVKVEIYDSIKDEVTIVACFDDRPKVVRALRAKGLKVFDCGMGYEF